MTKSKTYLKIINLESVDSTNNYALSLAQNGEREITVIKAKVQTKGKGRLGKKWQSPQNMGLYASFLIRPPNPLKEVCFFPLVSALGVVHTLKDILSVQIKLPNDIMVKDKKIGGVLVETKTTGETVDFAIVGIGININSEKKDLPLYATSLYLETGEKYNIDTLFKKLIKEFTCIYARFKKDTLSSLLSEAYRYQVKNSVLSQVYGKPERT